MSFQKILDKYRKISFSERDKGTRFERLMQAYLKTDPKYANKFKEVWLWNEFVGKKDLGGTDTGIDLVALTQQGDYWAIQCKFFKEDSYIDKPAVDTFLSTSGRTFMNEDMQTTKFAHRLWISTTNKWTLNANKAIQNQTPPVSRINLTDLKEAPVDWNLIEQGIHGEEARTAKKTLYPHQKEALDKTHEHFKKYDRGKLIMACGTGKTFNSLRIAENETDGKGLILFLVPSIALLGQTLREWSADAEEPINAIAICSDPRITEKRSRNEDADTFNIVDLAFPASTDTDYILHQFEQIKANDLPGMTVVFSTYQSIDVLARAQTAWMKKGFPEFDLIICDEAHRTTGVTLDGADESAFTKVHNNDFIKAKKRLYMTATPRLFSEDAQSKAAEAEAILCSMDDEKLYGTEMYRIGFGEAVERNLLTDYKVLILTLSDKDVPPAIQKALENDETEITTDDASKLVGTVNALSKQFLGDEGVTKASDPEPMRRAVAFCSNIATSKKISSNYNWTSETYLDALPAKDKEKMVSVSSQHMDGTMAAPQRDEMLSWLKEETDDNECRIITNVRVLSEGVDVPSLDAVLFLSARNSQVDVVQSVGRVMRKSPRKKYGYIVIPVIVPSDVEADVALDSNERYKVVWTVLNALRAHDDRFNATVNKIELNKRKPNNILIGRPQTTFGKNGQAETSTDAYTSDSIFNEQLAIQFEQLQSAIYARMVQKVGDRRYWEQWAKDVAIIAERQIERITHLIETRKDQRNAFDKFLLGLQKNINPSTSEYEAIEMLAQHIITKPIFEALFEGYSFEKNNAVSTAMQSMLEKLEGKSVAEESETLQKFYDSVRKRAEGIDNAEGKQRIIIELYDKFFKAAFPRMVEQLGIVYTPVEVVDFIIHSVNDVLKKEFGRTVSDENVHILDPFTGTGTFITRLLQSGLINKGDITRKYQHELHANEIVLLAYYIAAVNIENVYHDLKGKETDYKPFEGIVLTDTFQMGETDVSEQLFSETFPRNSERVERQKKSPVQIIMGNPPYSAKQITANDNAQNQSYPKLDSRISETYAKLTNAINKNSLYDSYIKAFRWSSDRLDKTGGIIAFISNSGWLNSNSADGFRKSLEKEFSSIYIFNLKGAIRGKSGISARREGQNIFDIVTGVSITLLVKNPENSTNKAKIVYADIGDFLTRKEKIAKLVQLKSFNNEKMQFKQLKPNKHGDWINKRNEGFEKYIPLGDKRNKGNYETFFVPFYSNGLKTQRDAWCYNSSSFSLNRNIKKLLDFYNNQLEIIKLKALKGNEIKDAIDYDSTSISWTRALIWDIEKHKSIKYDNDSLRTSLYRPFFKQYLYFDKSLNEMTYQIPKLFPKSSSENRLICVSGLGGNKMNSAIMTDEIVDLNCLDAGSQCFPLYYYEEHENKSRSLFDVSEENNLIRRDGITDFILERSKKQYGKNVNKEDVFYYIYGLLHSEDYRKTFANDLKKMLPRIPLVEDVRDFWKFSKAGRKLADLHINYEDVPAYEGVEVSGVEEGDDNPQLFKVTKMRFPKRDQKDTIIYNSKIKISNIPDNAYEYVVNGRSAIEWILDRYQVTTHKASGIKNDPNDWAEEVGNPRYILNLLLSIINVSVQTVDIVEGLPKLEFEEE